MRSDDGAFMKVAIEEAREALRRDEIPIGAIVVFDGEIVARGRNDRCAPFIHAEMSALAAAASALGRSRLDGCTLYSTLEPCPMCAGALLEMRVSRLVFGASDPKAGACGSLYDLVSDSRLPFRTKVRRGVMSVECADILQRFFIDKRKGEHRH